MGFKNIIPYIFTCFIELNYYAFGFILFYSAFKILERIFIDKPWFDNSSFLPKHLKHTYSLVLDLDETLIRSVITRANPSIPTIPIKINNKIAHFAVSKRPHLDTFLLEMRKTYEIVIYTASTQHYAEAILGHICINHLVDRILYRNDCILNSEGEYVKDLRKVRKDTSKVILIDNSLIAGSNFPDNFIPIDSWFGGSTDTALLDIMPLLRAFRNVSDVRLIIQLRYNETKVSYSCERSLDDGWKCITNDNAKDGVKLPNSARSPRSDMGVSFNPASEHSNIGWMGSHTQMNWFDIGERLNTKLKQLTDTTSNGTTPNTRRSFI